MDSTLKAVINCFAEDFVLSNHAYHSPDKQLIHNSYSDIFEYCHESEIKNQDVKEFTDTVLENIPGFSFGTFIKSLNIAENSTFEYVEYYKKKEEENSDKSKSENQKKSNNKQHLEKQSQKSAKNIQGDENDGNGENNQDTGGNQGTEQEANIIEKLAEEEIEKTANDMINGASEDDEDAEQGGAQSKMLGGKQAGKESAGKNPRDIADKIQGYLRNLKTLHRSLKNISAISTSILNGIEKVETGEGSIGYQYGRDLRNVDARDLSLLASPTTEHLFKLKYAKGELLQETSLEGKSIGDLIIAIDTSDSVCSAVHNKKYAATGTQILDLEFAIAVGMMRFAIKNKAKCKVILFESTAYYTSQWVRSEVELKKFLHTSLVQELETGGTSFEDAIKSITLELKNLYHVKHKPGVIFITDGHDSVCTDTQKQFLALKKQLKAKMYSYFVAIHDPLQYATSLTAISDHNYFINHSLDVESQMSSFTSIKSK